MTEPEKPFVVRRSTKRRHRQLPLQQVVRLLQRQPSIGVLPMDQISLGGNFASAAQPELLPHQMAAHRKWIYCVKTILSSP
ncbi:hypothetical protein NKI39_15760 [Mesorhizobium sp. M0664]|uniref:hypothetical protein n=1 Tax=Mesorhizobium sp. M0664 TaxID=2956982 RepID=UPI003338887C